MTIDLYNSGSDPRSVTKKLTAIKTITAEMYEVSSIIDPRIIVAYDAALVQANYCYIPYFKRYYFIRGIEVADGRRMMLTLHVDVLQTYATQIKSLQCIIDKQAAVANGNVYYNDGSYVLSSKQFNEVHNFSSGFNDAGAFILITAGG